MFKLLKDIKLPKDIKIPHLVSRFAYNTKVIVDTSSTLPAFRVKLL